ncbi:uncharacterized protein EI90DRAFT_3043060, partial [Cantharellus anzutake]|uniref:uncharacterized protein n=1 Tax=Cantharellus anzutake TaxID=1750568 RepID=UPI0019066B23
PFTAFGTLLLALSARTRACTLTSPDPAVGVTFEFPYFIHLENCTLFEPYLFQIWNRSGDINTMLEDWPVGSNPLQDVDP